MLFQEYWLYLFLFHGITNSDASSLKGPGGPAHPLFWVKKEEMTEGTKNSPPPPLPLTAQGLDLPPTQFCNKSQFN